MDASCDMLHLSCILQAWHEQGIGGITHLGVNLGYVRAVLSSNVNGIVPVLGLNPTPPVGWICPTRARSCAAELLGCKLSCESIMKYNSGMGKLRTDNVNSIRHDFGLIMPPKYGQARLITYFKPTSKIITSKEGVLYAVKSATSSVALVEARNASQFWNVLSQAGNWICPSGNDGHCTVMLPKLSTAMAAGASNTRSLGRSLRVELGLYLYM